MISLGSPVAPANDVEDYVGADERLNIGVDRVFNLRALIGIPGADDIVVERDDFSGRGFVGNGFLGRFRGDGFGRFGGLGRFARRQWAAAVGVLRQARNQTLT